MHSLSSKPRYEILDGLRGVAAMMVVMFHLFESYIGQIGTQIINHGYLAVDFFFMLSGFVIGYAYDDRWDAENKQGMGAWTFFKRRLVRLHPMVIAGTAMGCMLYYFGDCAMFGKVAATPWYVLLGMAVLAVLMLPAPARYDIRGWEETYPINGPQWSLMLEYIANIFYCFLLRRLPRKVLLVLLLVAAFFTLDLGLGWNVLGDRVAYQPNGTTLPLPYSGNFIGGWGIEGWQWHVALVRLSFPFLAGYLLSKSTRHIRLKGGFAGCALALIALLSVPELGQGDTAVYNGIYETTVVLLFFPLLISAGAGSTLQGRTTTAVCQWLGQISYPLYITHFGFVYMQIAWAAQHASLPVSTHIFVSVALFALSLLTAHALLKLYDLPVRRWLTQKWLQGDKQL